MKRYAAAVGLDATEFAGHSLRSGLATSAAAAGASERALWRRPAIVRLTWCAGTFGTGRCSGRMQQGR